MPEEFFDPVERARQKQRSRDADERALQSGAISAEELHQLNGNGDLFRDAKIESGPASLSAI